MGFFVKRTRVNAEGFEDLVWKKGPRKTIVKKTTTHVGRTPAGNPAYVVDCELECGHYVALPRSRQVLRQRTAHCEGCDPEWDDRAFPNWGS